MPKAEKSGVATGAPKRPASAYIQFANSVREDLKKEYPTLKMTELSKVIGEKWASLPKNEKDVFEEEYKKKKDEFEQVKKKYLEDHKEDIVPANTATITTKSATGKKKRSDAETIQKKPQKTSAYQEYMREHRKKIQDENPEASFGEISRILGAKWKEEREKNENLVKAKEEAD